MSKPRILVLSASTGNGHMSAAKAIADEAQARGLHALSVDTLDYCPKAYKIWYAGGYEMLVRRSPGVWGHFYEVSDKPGAVFDFQAVLDTAMCEGLEKLIDKEKPDWIVCTHSLPQPKVASLREKYGFKIAVVVTDLWPHAMWLRGNPDRFFVPQAWSRDELVKREPKYADRIEVVGMPIHTIFGHRSDPATVRAELSLPAKGSLGLIVSGGIGGGPMVGAVRAMSKVTDHVLAIAGRNKRLHKRLVEAFEDVPNVTVWGNTPQAQMAQALNACDFMVSKPGGLTTFEALAMGTPFVVFWPFLIPGQEEGNARFLIEEGCGAEAKKLKDLAPLVKSLVDNPDRLKAMSAACIKQSLPNATRRIVESLMAPVSNGYSVR